MGSSHSGPSFQGYLHSDRRGKTETLSLQQRQVCLLYSVKEEVPPQSRSQAGLLQGPLGAGLRSCDTSPLRGQLPLGRVAPVGPGPGELAGTAGCCTCRLRNEVPSASDQESVSTASVCEAGQLTCHLASTVMSQIPAVSDSFGQLSGKNRQGPTRLGSGPGSSHEPSHPGLRQAEVRAPRPAPQAQLTCICPGHDAVQLLARGRRRAGVLLS